MDGNARYLENVYTITVVRLKLFWLGIFHASVSSSIAELVIEVLFSNLISDFTGGC